MNINLNAKCKEATYNNGYIKLVGAVLPWSEIREGVRWAADMHGDEVTGVDLQESLKGWGEYTQLVCVSYRDAAPSYFAVAI